jgi:hypothetical protein
MQNAAKIGCSNFRVMSVLTKTSFAYKVTNNFTNNVRDKIYPHSVLLHARNMRLAEIGHVISIVFNAGMKFIPCKMTWGIFLVKCQSFGQTLVFKACMRGSNF